MDFTIPAEALAADEPEAEAVPEEDPVLDDLLETEPESKTGKEPEEQDAGEKASSEYTTQEKVVEAEGEVDPEEEPVLDDMVDLEEPQRSAEREIISSLADLETREVKSEPEKKPKQYIPVGDDESISLDD